MTTSSDIIDAIKTTILADATLKAWVQTVPKGSGRLHIFDDRRDPTPGTNQKPAVVIEEDPAWEFLERELNTNDRPIKQIFALVCWLPEKPDEDIAGTFANHIIRIINANDTLGGVIFDITPSGYYEREGSEPYEQLVIECDTQRDP